MAKEEKEFQTSNKVVFNFQHGTPLANSQKEELHEALTALIRKVLPKEVSFELKSHFKGASTAGKIVSEKAGEYFLKDYTTQIDGIDPIALATEN